MENKHNLKWVVVPFHSLSVEALYQILRLRSKVFVVEQKCNFLDADNKDQQCMHVLGYAGSELVAYSRIVPAGLSYPYPSIGRIVVSANGRGKGWGAALLQTSIAELEKRYGLTTIRIGAQAHLHEFYGLFGFEQTSGIYLEDAIEHIEMTRQPALPHAGA
ncbi:GNAT family N-acetyltransferase [Dyadobacter sandarakinus]|uniref:GNAT family N-acetyltransferase n=1 Tax=Dyadobacter sandarakinus TaxID=2747268 RepID=A0ABX7ICH3_9BACT|nr:GNAT family N-acetyltransferase [Dyadobacter sandarakinus]QRR03814.1 GNAT family N-acetyltransferase [Dyadobacter sandarakinus]